MGKIMMNGIQYGVGGITDASDIKYGSTDVESALDTISQSLSDGDVTYVKLPDGTMIVHATYTGIKSGDRITYPKQFVGTPHVFFSTNYNTGTTIRCIFTTSSASNTGFEIYAWDTSTNAVSTSTTLSVNILAIGRWK